MYTDVLWFSGVAGWWQKLFGWWEFMHWQWHWYEIVICLPVYWIGIPTRGYFAELGFRGWATSNPAIVTAGTTAGGIRRLLWPNARSVVCGEGVPLSAGEQCGINQYPFLTILNFFLISKWHQFWCILWHPACIKMLLYYKTITNTTPKPGFDMISFELQTFKIIRSRQTNSWKIFAQKCKCWHWKNFILVNYSLVAK